MNAEATRILIVEDDPGLRTLLTEYLVARGFMVHAEGRGDTALSLIDTFAPDIVILDLMLPGLDGFEICRAARRNFQGGILMLTASKTDADQLRGLELGADDYVLKPVQPKLLLARLRALLRRIQPSDAPVSRTLEVGRLSADRARRAAHVQGQRLDLTGAEFDVLWLLMRFAGDVVRREELHREVRGVEYNGLDRSIDINVSRLRRKLRGAGLEESIKSVRGVGYLLVTP
ncbi:MAG: response regulator transcription factor [Myxococcota bacterium]